MRSRAKTGRQWCWCQRGNLRWGATRLWRKSRSFKNARYCNCFSTLRRNPDTVDDSINSIVSDIFSLFPNYLVSKMVTVVLGK